MTADRTVTTERTIAADPDVVWDAFTTDEGFATWNGEGATIDPTPGGAIETPDTGLEPARIGAVEHVEPPSTLRYRWWPADEPDEVSTVEVVLAPAGDGTTVTVTEHLVLAPVTPLRARHRGPQLLAA